MTSKEKISLIMDSESKKIRFSAAMNGMIEYMKVRRLLSKPQKEELDKKYKNMIDEIYK